LAAERKKKALLEQEQEKEKEVLQKKTQMEKWERFSQKLLAVKQRQKAVLYHEIKLKRDYIKILKKKIQEERWAILTLKLLEKHGKQEGQNADVDEDLENPRISDVTLGEGKIAL
jgi:hypothetical protein